MGSPVAELFAEHGASVALVGRNENDLTAVAERIEESGGSAHIVPADLTDPTAGASVVDSAASRLGGVDILVNNAGGAWPR